MERKGKKNVQKSEKAERWGGVRRRAFTKYY